MEFSRSGNIFLCETNRQLLVFFLSKILLPSSSSCRDEKFIARAEFKRFLLAPEAKRKRDLHSIAGNIALPLEPKPLLGCGLKARCAISVPLVVDHQREPLTTGHRVHKGCTEACVLEIYLN